ncbi:MAG: hypothetical protein ACJ8AJ_07270, partial [Gemmatimonadaceae bacterium]
MALAFATAGRLTAPFDGAAFFALLATFFGAAAFTGAATFAGADFAMGVAGFGAGGGAAALIGITVAGFSVGLYVGRGAKRSGLARLAFGGTNPGFFLPCASSA